MSFIKLPSEAKIPEMRQTPGHGKAEASSYSKPLCVPDACYECTEYKCHTCPHGCKIGLIIGKQYPAEHVFH